MIYLGLELIFLGGGGGRWESIVQNKGTGGFRIHDEHLKAHVDPGPGALVRMSQLKVNPWKTDVLIVSHCVITSYSIHYTKLYEGEITTPKIISGEKERNNFV